MKIEVYARFGRTVKMFHVPDNETHHKTLEEARKFSNSLDRETWIRFHFNKG